MKKQIIIVLCIVCLYASQNIVYASSENNIDLKSQEEKYGIGEFLSDSKKYTNDIDLSNIFSSIISGKMDNSKILKYILNILGNNFKDSLGMIAGVIVVVIINSILKTISENLGNESVSKIAFYIQYILVVTLIMSNFSNIIVSIKQSLQDLTSFSNILIPLLTTLMCTTGNIVSSKMIEPILLIIISFMGNFINNCLIPIILVATALGIISKISSQMQVGKLSKFLKKGSVWVLTTVLALFISVASVEGGITSGLDGMTLKAGKSLVSTVVPVVGSIFGDALDTVLGYTNIIKNAVGVIGIIVIVGICLKPVLQLTAITVTYYLGAALCEPIADKKIIELIEEMAGTFKIFLAVMVSISIMLVVGVAIVMKISNSGLMYQ